MDSIYELTTEKNLLKNSVDVSQDENIALTTQVLDLEVKVVALETLKDELLKLMDFGGQSDAKLKRKISESELELEEKLKEG